MLYVNVKELPGILRHILHKIGFLKKEIALETVKSFCLKHEACLRYNRGFCVVVDLKTSKYKIGYGSFGGSNQKFKTIVDDCEYNFHLPPNYAVIKGEHGSRGLYAILCMRHDADLPAMLNNESLDCRIYKIIKIYKIYTGTERKEKLFSANTLDLQLAIKESLLAERKNGFKLTKRGKKFIKNFEEQNPTKKLG